MAVLLVILLAIGVYDFVSSGNTSAAPPPATSTTTSSAATKPAIPGRKTSAPSGPNTLDPTLHLNVLEASRRVKYEPGRNIFRMEEAPIPKPIIARETRRHPFPHPRRRRRHRRSRSSSTGSRIVRRPTSRFSSRKMMWSLSPSRVTSLTGATVWSRSRRRLSPLKTFSPTTSRISRCATSNRVVVYASHNRSESQAGKTLKPDQRKGLRAAFRDAADHSDADCHEH